MFHEGDPGDALHLIDKGHISIRVTTALGDVATLAVVGPGEGFGEGALLTPDSRRSASAVAVVAAETRTLTGADFEDLRTRHPRVERLLTEQLALQVRRLSESLVEAHYVAADVRVVRRLSELVDLFTAEGGTGDAAAGRGTVPVTQQELASMAGTTRPTANRVLRELEDAGVVTLGRGRISVEDIDALRARTD